MRVAVVGTGYVGLVSGLVLAERGHEVVFLDTDAEKIAALRRGELPFFEPGLEPLLVSTAAATRAHFVTSYEEIADCEVALLSVATPADEDGSSDTRALADASEQLARIGDASSSRLRAVFVRSSVVPGTTRGLVRARFEARSGRAATVKVGTIPEFLREGRALDDQRRPDRIVVGADDAEAFALAGALYAGVDAPRLETTPETAELIKLTNNAMLSTCISLANEVARIAERLPGVDAEAVFAGVHLDRRLGGATPAGLVEYLRPGAGFGGSCLGKDLRVLATFGRLHGEPTPLLDAVSAVNDDQPLRLLRRVSEALGGLAGRRLLVLGLAFKPGTEDVRGSIALPLVTAAVAEAAEVRVHDPRATDAFLRALPSSTRSRVHRAAELPAELGAVDAVLLLTAWEDYGTPLARMLEHARGPLLIADGRGLLRGRSLPGQVRYLGVGLGPLDERDESASRRT